MRSHFVASPLVVGVGLALVSSAMIVGCSSASENTSDMTTGAAAKDAGTKSTPIDSGKGTTAGQDAATGSNTGDDASSDTDGAIATGDDTDAAPGNEVDAAHAKDASTGDNDGLTAPAQASAAGYSNLVFDDEFTTTTTTTTSATAQTGFKWYPNFWAGSHPGDVEVNVGKMYAVNGVLTATAPASPTAAQTATGVLTLSSAGGECCLSTVPGGPAYDKSMGAHPALPGSFQHAYFETRMQVNPNNTGTGGWPSFWSFGTSTFSNIYTQTHSDGFPEENTAEFDFIETYPQVQTSQGVTTKLYGINTLHDWNGGTDAENTGSNNYMEYLTGNSENLYSTVADGNFHTYGALWVKLTATTGYVEFYFDDYLVIHNDNVTRYLTGVGTGTNNPKIATVNGVVTYTPAGAGLTSQEQEYMYLILGGADGWPNNVDWVRVWQ